MLRIALLALFLLAWSTLQASSQALAAETKMANELANKTCVSRYMVVESFGRRTPVVYLHGLLRFEFSKGAAGALMVRVRGKEDRQGYWLRTFNLPGKEFLEDYGQGPVSLNGNVLVSTTNTGLFFDLTYEDNKLKGSASDEKKKSKGSDSVFSIGDLGVCKP